MTYKVEPRKTSLKGLRGKGKAEKITKAEHKRLSKIWDDCARAYLRAIILSDVIRVDTGMSKASLLPLARYLRMYTEVSQGVSFSKREKGSFTSEGVWQPDVDRTAALGERLGAKRAGYNMLYGGPKRMVFQFDFEIKVWQYLIYEQGFGKDAAWDTIGTGRAAFNEHFDIHFRLQGPREWGLHDR